jgi:hypothetical protein
MKGIRLILVGLSILITSQLLAENRISFYQNSFGQINESVDIALEKGDNLFSYDTLPNGFQEKTMILTPSKGNTFQVLSQSFSSKPNDFHGMLSSHKDKEIEVVTKDGAIISGYLFYNDYDVIGIKADNKGYQSFVRINEIRNYQFKEDNNALNNKPTVTWELNAQKKGKYTANVAYIASGLNWEGVYKVIWDEEVLQVNVMANLTNSTGRDFNNYNISLVAGDPKKVENSGFERYKLAASRGAEMALADASYGTPQFNREELDDYHIYSYSKKIDIVNGESKEIQLYPTAEVKPNLSYEYNTYSKQVQTKLKIKNDEQNGLGKPLPQGVVQIYRKNNDDNTIDFIGEDTIGKLPINEEWTISPGNAFDLVGETTVLATRQPSNRVTERDLQVKIRNQSKKSREVVIIHNLIGNWNILKNSYGYERIDANKVQFKKTIKPNEEFIVTWTESNQ